MGQEIKKITVPKNDNGTIIVEVTGNRSALTKANKNYLYKLYGQMKIIVVTMNSIYTELI